MSTHFTYTSHLDSGNDLITPSKKLLTPFTFLIGAAIEKSMAKEIFHQLETQVMTNAANLTNDDQLISICNWLILL